MKSGKSREYRCYARGIACEVRTETQLSEALPKSCI